MTCWMHAILDVLFVRRRSPPAGFVAKGLRVLHWSTTSQRRPGDRLAGVAGGSPSTDTATMSKWPVKPHALVDSGGPALLPGGRVYSSGHGGGGRERPGGRAGKAGSGGSAAGDDADNTGESPRCRHAWLSKKVPSRKTDSCGHHQSAQFLLAWPTSTCAVLQKNGFLGTIGPVPLSMANQHMRRPPEKRLPGHHRPSSS